MAAVVCGLLWAMVLYADPRNSAFNCGEEVREGAGFGDFFAVALILRGDQLVKPPFDRLKSPTCAEEQCLTFADLLHARAPHRRSSTTASGNPAPKRIDSSPTCSKAAQSGSQDAQSPLRPPPPEADAVTLLLDAFITSLFDVFFLRRLCECNRRRRYHSSVSIQPESSPAPAMTIKAAATHHHAPPA